MIRYLRKAHDSLAFFVGGDNGIAVCSAMDAAAYRDTIDQVREAVEVDLKVGVGRARTAQAAGMNAKHELERCRADGSRVELGWE